MKVVVFSFLLLTLLAGCVTRPVTPAQPVAFNFTEMAQADAKKRFRKKLTEAMIATESGMLHGGVVSRTLEDRDFRGAKSADNGNDVAFIYGESLGLGLGGVRESIVLTDIGKGAELELFYIAPFVTGLANYQNPESFVLLISNSNICRALNIERVKYIGGSWSFSMIKGFSSAACYGARTGTIRNLAGKSGMFYHQLKMAKPDYSEENTAVLMGGRSQLEELASIIKAAFSNVQ